MGWLLRPQLIICRLHIEADESGWLLRLGLRTHRNFWLLIVVLRLWLYKQGVAWLSTTSTVMR